MASDIFMKIGDIKGESRDDKHKDEIEVMSFSWGVSQAGTAHPVGGASAGKAQFSDFSFASNVSKASPKLFLACASGEHIKDAQLSVRRGDSDKGQEDYLIIKMNDVIISSYQTTGAESADRSTESVSMAFAKIEYSYRPQNARGELEPAITTGWDLKKNVKI